MGAPGKATALLVFLMAVVAACGESRPDTAAVPPNEAKVELSPEQAAAQLVVEAHELLRSVSDNPELSYKEAYETVSEAVLKLDTVVSNYPATPTAADLVQGKARLLDRTYDELRRKYLPDLEFKAHAEGNVIGAAFGVARTIADSRLRAMSLVELCRLYHTANEGRRAARCLELACEAARKVDDDAVREVLLADVSGAYAETGMIEEARRIMGSLNREEARARARRRLAVVLAKRGDCEAAGKTAGMVEEPYHRARSLGEVSRACHEAGKIEEALRLLQQVPAILRRIQDPLARGEVSVETAAALAELGDVQAATGLAGRIAGKHYRRLALIRVATALAEKGKTADAKSLLVDLADERQKATASEWTDEDALGELSSAYADTHLREQVVQLLAEGLRESQHIAQDFNRVPAITRIAIKFWWLGQHEQAEESMGAARRLAAQSTDKDIRLGMLDDIAKAYAEMGAVDEALNALPKDEYFTFKELTQVKIVQAALQVGTPDKAVGIARSITAKSLPDNDVGRRYQAIARAVAFASVARWFEDQGELKSASGAMDEAVAAAKEGGLWLTLPRVLEEACAGSGRENVAAVLRAATAIDDPAARAEVLTAWAEVLLRCGRPKLTVQVLDTVLVMLETVEPGYQREHITALAARLLAQTGKTSEALELAKAVKNQSSRNEAQVVIVGKLATEGRAYQAFRLIEKMRGRTRYEEQAEAYLQVANGCLEVGESYHARQALDRALQAARKVRNEMWHHAYIWRLAAGLTRAGRNGDALGLLAKLPETSRPLAIIQMVEAAVAEGDFGEARRLTQMLAGNPYHASAAARTARGMAKRHQFEEATGLAESLPDPAVRAGALLAVSVELVKAGRGTDAESLLHNTLEVIRGIPPGTARVSMLQAAAVAYAHIVAPPRLPKALVAVDEGLWMGEGRAQLAIALGKAGLFADARTVLDTLADGPFRRKAVAGVAIELATAGRTDEAMKLPEALEDPADRAFVLVTTGSALAETTKSEAGRSFTEGGLALLTDAQPSVFKGRILIAGALAYSRGGDELTARKSLLDILRMATMFSDPAERAEILTLGARTYGELRIDPGLEEQAILRVVVKQLE